MNDELINSAVAFLQDPNVASSPLTKKIEFLESKGLNQQEIEEALNRAKGESSSSSSSSSTITPTNSNTRSSSNYHSSQQQNAPLDYYNVAPPLPERSWKDYFIMATATAGVTYGLYSVITRYLVPAIIPPAQSAIEQDKEVINEEFIKIDKILEQLTKEQEEIKASNEEKLKDVDTVIENINDFLTKYNKDKLKFDDDLRFMKLETDKLSLSVDKSMKFYKENVHEQLEELSDELQSLKNLIKSRSEVANSNGGGGATGARNIAPVSSIPSASDILKKSRAKMETPAKDSASKSTPTSAAAAAATEAETRPANGRTRSSDVTEAGLTAAGIPTWQMKHKQEEDVPKNESSSANDNSNVGIPAWQQASQSTAANTEEEVKEKIKSAGIPPWQLNSGANKSDNSGSGNASASDDKKSSGIPSWQTAASSSSS
ncbi:uncharacterized protein LODBEIA_P16640 [Lodderomyces beijingensis]|uniref:Peroxisomal membrane protein PEX14 n=1 Tax=Lodderomyces beijingensis TaxID=1775926 RepID=A0ABP0ZME1_9ASCO